MSTVVRAYDFVFPVLAGNSPTPETSDPQTLCGTAFPVGGDVFLTAGHVVNTAKEYATADLAFLPTDVSTRWMAAPIAEMEIFDAYDLARVRVPRMATAIAVRAVPWKLEKRAMLEPIQTLGYPHGFDREGNGLGIRAFRGYIVADVARHPKLSSRPLVYELSFHSPRGLSAAPLWTGEPGLPLPRVCGVMLANEIMEMAVHTEKEIEDGRPAFIKTEALHLGLAVSSRGLGDIDSAMLGCSLQTWLERHNLVER